MDMCSNCGHRKEDHTIGQHSCLVIGCDQNCKQYTEPVVAPAATSPIGRRRPVAEDLEKAKEAIGKLDEDLKKEGSDLKAPPA